MLSVSLEENSVNIYLTGLIGAGKTTIGIPLAEQLGWAYDDLDLAMQKMAGKDFRQVVAEEGWLGFRQREYSLCKQFANLQRTVIGLGGGTVRYDWNRDVLRGSGCVILLIADLKVLAERVRDNDRPRVNPGVTLEADLQNIWENYQHLYLSFADLIYPTDQGKSISEEVEDIITLLNIKQIQLL